MAKKKKPKVEKIEAKGIRKTLSKLSFLLSVILIITGIALIIIATILTTTK